MTGTIAKPNLTDREQQVVQGIADGLPLSWVAERLKIKLGTAQNYLRLAKHKFGVSENTALTALAYETGAIAEPEALDDEADLTATQLVIIRLIAKGMSSHQIAAELRLPLTDVRKEGRVLLQVLNAQNPAHIVTRARQLGLLVPEGTR